MAHDVFISYSTKDVLHAETVRNVLETNGISCWIAPRDIPGGSNYTKEIPSAIRNCSVFVLILSQVTETSIWVYRELDLAVNNRKVILPLMLEDFAIGDEFNFLLTGCQRYAAYERKSEVLETLVKRIRSIIGVETGNAHPSPKASLVRMDGVYQGPRDNNQRCFLRFFPDGTVAYTRYTCKKPKPGGTPFPGSASLQSWFNEDFPIRKPYDTKSKQFALPFTSEKFKSMEMLVTINTPEELTLRVCWDEKKSWQELKMQFVPVEFPTSKAVAPKKAITSIFGPVEVPVQPKPTESQPKPAAKTPPAAKSTPVIKPDIAVPTQPKHTPVSTIPEKQVHKLPLTPEPAEVWNKPKHDFVRIDGIYQSQLKNGCYRYLRFSSLNYNRVFHIQSNCLPCEVMRWFHYQGVQEGTCSYSKTDVHIRIESMVFMGNVGKNVLTLRSYFANCNEEDEYTFTFIPFPESSYLEDGILGFADDPVYRFKLLFAGNPQPRYDGYYCSDEAGPGKTYLRFYPTGEVYETFHVGPAKDALPNLKIQNRNGGIRFHAKYNLSKSIINFTIEHPFYKTKIRYHGKVVDDGLLMEAKYSAFDRTVTQKYTFHKVYDEFF